MLRELTAERATLFWKTTEAGYLDIDGLVNANALLYLGERPETAAIVRWLIEIVRTSREATCDKWYRDAFSLYYAPSRNYRAGVRALGVVVPEILARLRGAAADTEQIGENCLQTALAVNTMLNLGVEPDAALTVRALDYLLATQSVTGSWPSAPYNYGGPRSQWVSRDSELSPEIVTGACNALKTSPARRGCSTILRFAFSIVYREDNDYEAASSVTDAHGTRNVSQLANQWGV